MPGRYKALGNAADVGAIKVHNETTGESEVVTRLQVSNGSLDSIKARAEGSSRTGSALRMPVAQPAIDSEAG